MLDWIFSIWASHASHILWFSRGNTTGVSGLDVIYSNYVMITLFFVALIFFFKYQITWCPGVSNSGKFLEHAATAGENANTINSGCHGNWRHWKFDVHLRVNFQKRELNWTEVAAMCTKFIPKCRATPIFKNYKSKFRLCLSAPADGAKKQKFLTYIAPAKK